jgi:hypothetical protein
MKLTYWLQLAVISVALPGSLWSQTAFAQKPHGKIAPRPLYRDQQFDAPTDPVLVFNADQKKWLMY